MDLCDSASAGSSCVLVSNGWHRAYYALLTTSPLCLLRFLRTLMEDAEVRFRRLQELRPGTERRCASLLKTA